MRYHKGMKAENALILMKARYSAYAAGALSYIVKTTHPSMPGYISDRESFRAEISLFIASTVFKKLEIVEFVDGEEEAFVEFIAYFDGDSLRERSRFVKEGDEWLYREATIY